MLEDHGIRMWKTLAKVHVSRRKGCQPWWSRPVSRLVLSGGCGGVPGDKTDSMVEGTLLSSHVSHRGALVASSAQKTRPYVLRPAGYLGRGQWVIQAYGNTLDMQPRRDGFVRPPAR